MTTVERKKPSHRRSVSVSELGLMRWLDGGGVGPLNTLRTIGVSALVLAILASPETWIEYTARRGPPEVAAGVERVELGLPPGAESSPTP
jgi:hypothetical protein